MPQNVGDVFNLNGPPTLALQTQSHELIGKVISATPSSILKSPLPDDNNAVVAAFVYGRTESKASLFLNGTPVAESQVSSPIAVRSPKFIGASNSRDNFFNGDLCEIILFDSSLAAETCSQISTDLMHKYGVERVDREPKILARPIPSAQ